MKNESGKNKKLRVLFSGLGFRMIDNLIDHISSEYATEKCEAKEINFEKAIKSFMPHVVVICLQDERGDEMKAYNILVNESDYVCLPVLVIGKDEDCELFRKKNVIKNCTILARPIKMDVFLPSLNKLAAESVVNMKWDEIADSEQNNVNAVATDVRKSILVVDDDIRMLNLIKMYLQDIYDVAVVPSGKLALKFLQSKHADLVLLDYMMPVMSGPQVLAEIRMGNYQSNVPVLFLTGVADKELVMRSLQFYPDGYLLKPITMEELHERVTAIFLGI